MSDLLEDLCYAMSVYVCYTEQCDNGLFLICIPGKVTLVTQTLQTSQVFLLLFASGSPEYCRLRARNLHDLIVTVFYIMVCTFTNNKMYVQPKSFKVYLA